LIDLAWNSSIRPLLLAKFPCATEAELIEAHAYAYGGSAVQDIGYYPFGKRFFSNLTHYVRTGDFVAWMLRNHENIFVIGPCGRTSMECRVRRQRKGLGCRETDTSFPT
jgi:hypothetical protein